VAELDALYQRLLAPRKRFSGPQTVQGLYLWGQVGIGKSFLVDLFFAALPETGKTRQHYQHFMAEVHRKLNAITGQANPLRIVGKQLAAQYRVICLDELYITDLGDAMIVYHLFESLFREGVVLLITSNFAPEKLYRDDLQPKIFEPAIRLIKANTLELHLASTLDYRTLQEGEHRTWFVASELDFSKLFEQLNQELNHTCDYSSEALHIQQHVLQPVRHQDQLVWFTYSELCDRPRSARDYIMLGAQFKVFMLSDIPQFGSADLKSLPTIGTEDSLVAGNRQQYADNENAQRRFISLVDELYDQGIKLYLQGAVPLPELYAGGRLAFEFQRTISRLTEMQTQTYRKRALRS